VSLSGKGVPNNKTLVATPTAVVFTDQPVNTSTDAAGTSTYVTVTNTGNVTVTFSGIAFTGDFARSSYPYQCGTYYTTLSPNGVCTIYLVFAPTVTGTRNGTLTITSDASTSPQSVSLAGKGIATQATGVLNPAAINFGAQTQNVSTTYQGISYTNTGNVPLTISAVNVTGDFSIFSNGCSSAIVPPASYCYVYVLFTPTTTGPRSGSLTILDNSTAGSHSAQLSGTGIDAAQAIRLSQNNVNFGSVVIGKTSPATNVYYSNQGASRAQITNLGITGDFSFAGSNCFISQFFNQGSYCYFSISFTPTAAGPRTGTLTITDTASGSPRTVSLNGTGVNPFPVVQFQPGNVLNFANTNLGSSSIQQGLALNNTGTANLTFTAPPAVSGDYALTANNCTSPITPGSGCTFFITFTPTAAGLRTGTLTFTSNASTSPDHVTLSGTGISGATATLAPNNIAFGNQIVGTSSAASPVTLSNTGTTALSITSIVASADFSQTNNCTSSLAAHTSCTINVVFSPTVVGNRQGFITLTDNAPGSPQQVSLAGVGLASPQTAVTAPTSLTFSNQPLTVTSNPQFVTLRNTGSNTLNITSVVASGDYAQTNNCPAGLLGGQFCTISVTFTPTAAGTRSGAITFTDNAANSPQTVTLSGVGVNAPLVTLSGTTLNFPNTSVGSTSVAQNVTLTNTGFAALNVSSITQQPNTSTFNTTTNCPASLAINASCTISVTFAPTAVGLVNNYYIQINDDAYNTPQFISLTGTGTGPAASLNPSSLTFANQTVNTTSAS
jgi:hypothetical protein